MAKSVRKDAKNIQNQFDELSQMADKWKQINEAKAKGQKIDEQVLKYLEKTYGSMDNLQDKINDAFKSYEKLSAEIEHSNDKIKESLENFDDIDNTMTSISNQIGKNTKLYGKFSELLGSTKVTMQSVSNILQKSNDLSDGQVDAITKATEAYEKMNVSIANASKDLMKGNLTQEEFNDIVKKSYENFEDLKSAIDSSTESGKEIVNIFGQAKKNAEDFKKAAEKSSKAMGMLDTAVDQLGSSGIPLVGEMGQAFQKLAKKDIPGAKAAITALGAAAAGLAFNYFGADQKAAAIAANDVKQTAIDGAREVGKIQSDAAFIPQKIQLEKDKSAIESANEIAKLNNEAAFASQKAANSFSASMKMAAAQFTAASKTALFGNKLGGVGYGAAQLQMAGIGAEKIAGAMSAASAATGKMPTGKMGADMAIMAERTGQSVESIASINEMFQRMDGMSAQTAMNMQEGMRAMADNAGISLSNLMTEVAEASKDALSYQIKSGPALAKQVAYAQSLGVSFGDIAKAGKSMVMNYKDSIKAEMQLSSLLGEQVDLSEVRAKFAEGDTQGALEAIKAQGLDPAQMDMFQQEALSQALGGMDLSSLSKIATGQGAQVGGLQAGNAGAQNQSFLSRTVGAQAAMEAQQAKISADQAIVDAKLAEQINQAYLGSEAYTTYQTALSDAAIKEQELTTAMTTAFQQTPAYIQSIADSAKLSIERTFSENWGTMLATTIGGVLSNFLASKLGGGGGGGFFGGGGGGTPDPSDAAGGGKKGFFGKIGGFFSKMGGKVMNSGVGKMLGGVTKLAKGLPLVGNVMSGVSALGNAFSGNWASAGADLLGMLPVVGNVVNVARATGLTSGIEASLNQKISGAVSGGTPSAPTPSAAPAVVASKPVSASGTPTSVATSISGNAEKILDKIQKEADTRGIILAQKIENVFRKMTEVNGNMQRTVDRTHKSSASLAIIDTTTQQMLRINKNIQALIGVLANEEVAATKLLIDGKAVANMLARRTENRIAQNIPPTPGGG